MKAKTIFSVALVCGFFVLFLSLKPGMTQVSTDNAFPPEDQEFANQLLQAREAQFLSGSALNALNVISGKVTAGQPLERGGHVDNPPFQSSRFQVMVNDPAQDTFTASDVSTQSETAVAGFGSNVVVTFNDSGSLLQGSPAQIFRSVMGYSRSADGGATFTDLGRLPTSPTGFSGGDPGLVANRSGDFYVSAIAFDSARPPGFRNTLSIQKSTNGGLSWGSPTYLPVAGPPLTFQDKEFIAVDNTGGTFNGNVYVSWTRFGPPFGQLPIFFSRSTDGGATLSTPIQISPAGSFNQGSEPVVGPNGEIYVAWFRFFGFPPAPGPPLPPAIIVAKSTDGGTSFSPPVLVAPVEAIGFGSGNLLGNFRVNSFPRIDVNPLNGDVYIVYAANPPGPDGADIFFTRSADGGASWSAPIRVNDDPGTNDQFFPDVAVNGQGLTEVFWYDKRLDPENIRLSVYKAQSSDGGLSFGSNQKVTLGTSHPAVGYDPFISRTYMGDYIDIKSSTTSTGNGRGPNFLLAWGDFRRVITTLGGTRPDQDVFFTTH